VVTRLCGILPHLTRAGHEVLLFAPQGAPPEYAGARIVGVRSFRFYLYPEKRFARPWPRVGRELKAFRPHLIHAVNPGFLAFSSIYYARRLGVPLVMSYHTHIPAYARYYGLPWLEPLLWSSFRAVHNRACLNLCPSSATRDELVRRGFRNVYLWERGVDLSLFTPARRDEGVRRLLLGGVSDGKVLLYVGRLAAEKGIERLRACLDVLPDVHLAIVGDGPYRAELERIFAGSRCTFTGYLFGEDLAKVYASADGFVFPSTTETLGLVLLEAMASGLPIAAAESPATREVLRQGEMGLLFHPDDPEQLVHCVDKLLHDEDWRTSAREQALAAASGFDWETSAEQLLHYYEQAINGFRTAHSKRKAMI
jgi:glycosyltransferase involved in cell wall biosynthesis